MLKLLFLTTILELVLVFGLINGDSNVKNNKHIDFYIFIFKVCLN